MRCVARARLLGPRSHCTWPIWRVSMAPESGRAPLISGKRQDSEETYTIDLPGTATMTIGEAGAPGRKRFLRDHGSSERVRWWTAADGDVKQCGSS
jgi:hypothetical protein